MRAVLFLVLLCLVSCARRYVVDGMVVSVDAPRRRLIVAHSAIPKLMPAMRMPFDVRDSRELDGLHPGARIRFRFNVARQRSWISGIRQFPSSAESLSAELGGALVEPPSQAITIGDPAPSFTLIDQKGDAAGPMHWRGKVVAINFIYTRCPLPEVCPRLAASFAALQRRFADRLGRDLILVSVTLDPQHDTPEVLARYAVSVKAVSGAWLFLTGTFQDVARVAGYFGVAHWAEEGVIVHTSSTVFLGRDGRLKARVEGSSFPLSQLARLTAHLLEE
jgi:protein SCO1/2